VRKEAGVVDEIVGEGEVNGGQAFEDFGGAVGIAEVRRSQRPSVRGRARKVRRVRRSGLVVSLRLSRGRN